MEQAEGYKSYLRCDTSSMPRRSAHRYKCNMLNRMILPDQLMTRFRCHPPQAQQKTKVKAWETLKTAQGELALSPVRTTLLLDNLHNL
ncbi:unnamed protein product [Ixodes persulcatus]